MILDANQCYEAIKACDARFDGMFLVGVSTTGVYCRPVCTARTPGRDRCAFFMNAACAEAAGYRPCLRCRPELAPGKAPIDAGRRVAHLVANRIEAGALCDSTVAALATEFGLSARQLRRIVEQEYGVTPLALAQTRRLLLAKQLLTDTTLRAVDVAFASGFSSVRQFNRLFRARYDMSPTAIRRKRKPSETEGITLKLGYRPPLAWEPLVSFLTTRGNSRIECMHEASYVRSVRIDERYGWIAAQPLGQRNQLAVKIAPSLVATLPRLLIYLRRLFDLDANPAVIDVHLGKDRRLRDRVRDTPGLRVPGAMDGFELALRAVLGQQVTVKAATTLFGRLVATFGRPVSTPYPGLDRCAPRASDIAQAELAHIASHGLTQRRAATVLSLARGVANGDILLDPTANPRRAREALLAIPGIGPWTADYVGMRAFGDPDAFPHADLGLLRTLNLHRQAELQAVAKAWRPWRAYAALHLWSTHGKGG